MKQKAEEDRRAEDQDTALEEAFVAGVLPEEDRRAEDIPPQLLRDIIVSLPVLEVAPPVAANPNDELSVVRERADGVRVTAQGHILDVPSVAPKPPPTGPGFE